MEKEKIPTNKRILKYESGIYIFIIIIWCTIIYFNSLDGEFVFDDESVVQNNLSIRELNNIPKFFTGEEGFHKVIGRYYRPVVSTSYAIDYWLWGLKPAGFKITNLIIHLINCLLLYFLLLNMFKEFNKKKFIAFLATMIFTAHTIHTEAVTWISGRTDSLVTIWFFSSLICYIKFTEDNRKTNLVLSLIFYFIGLITKEMIITLPLIIFLYDAVFKKRDKTFLKSKLIVYILFVAVTLFFLLIRYIVFLNVAERERYLYFYGMDGITVFATMLKTIPVYIKLIFLPINLLYHYNGVLPDAKNLVEPAVIVSMLIIISFIIVAIVSFKKHSVVTFCILFFFISLLPVMNIVPTMNLMAERFLYLPSFCLSVIIMYLLLMNYDKKYYKALVIIIISVILIFSYLTYKRNFDWKNNNTLYSTAEGIDGTVLLVNSGNIYANKQNFDEAAKRYLRALEIRDNNVLAHHNLGLIYLIRNQLDSAEYRFKKGISIDSLAPDGYFQLGNLYASQGKLVEAIEMFEKLQKIIPDYMGSKEILEDLKSGKEISTETIKGLNQNIERLDKEAYEHFQKGEYEESVKKLKKLIEINPSGKIGSYCNIGLNYFAMKKFDLSIENYKLALEIDSKNIIALSGIADSYLGKGERKTAEEYYNRILELDPTNKHARNKLDSLSNFK